MYPLDDVLRKKESQAERLRREIEALRLAAQIMDEVDERPASPTLPRQDAPKSWP
jgi:hypothetical protein